MEQPWRIGADDEVQEVHPLLPDFVPGDWAGVEAWLDVRLPHDYKELVGDGAGVVFDEELVIASPFSRTNHLGRQIAYGSWSLAYVRHRHGKDFAVPLFPERGGLMSWGQDGGGGVYYWNTMGSDPDTWTIVVSGRSVGDAGLGQLHECSLMAYLSGLASGRIEAAALGGWPGRDAQIRPARG